MPVDAQKDTRIVRHLKAREHVGGSRAAGQDVAAGLAVKLRVELQKGHDRGKSRLLLEAAVTHIHIHRLEHVHHLLLSPHEFIEAFGGHRHENRKVKQILVVVGDALLDVVARLDGVCQLLIVRAGILHALELGAVETDSLCHFIDGLAAVFPMQVYVNIDPVPGVDECGHPSGPHTGGVAVAAYVKKTVIEPVHNDVVVMSKVHAARGDEVVYPDLGDSIDPDDQVSRSHAVHDNAVYPGFKGLFHTGTAVEEHVQDLRRSLIGILVLHNGVAALHKIGAGILLHRLNRAVDQPKVLTVAPPLLLILINKEKTPGQGFTVAHISYKADIAFGLTAAFLVGFALQILTQQPDMPIGVGFPCDALELQVLGRNLQPGGKGGDDIELLLLRAQHEVDGLDLQDLDIAIVRCFNDPVMDTPDRDEILDELKQLCAAFLLFSFCVS